MSPAASGSGRTDRAGLVGHTDQHGAAPHTDRASTAPHTDRPSTAVPTDRRDVPLRRSLLVRLLAVSALVSVCSVAATAWVVVRTTAVAIGQERGQALADDTRIYDGLLGYAATHPDWSGAGHLTGELAHRTGHRIVLLDKSGRTLADSESATATATAHGHAPAPGSDATHPPYRPPDKPTAVIDPLAVDPQLVPGAEADGIDPRAVGPFRLPADERDRLARAAAKATACLRRTLGVEAHVETAPGGRPRVVTADQSPVTGTRCASTALDAPTPTETRALKALNSLVDTCLARRGTGPVPLTLDPSGQPAVSLPDPTRPAPRQAAVARPAPGEADATNARAASCLANSRSQQLAPLVAPGARLYVSSPGRTATTFFDLSPGNRLRIAASSALVLLVTVAVTTFAGIRLVRPLRALTQAVRRMEDGDVGAQVAVAGGAELGRLAGAFNAMSARRAQLEAGRRAMTSDVAHELRTPLSNIRGWLEAVQDGVARPDDKVVSLLLGQARLLQHIIDDLRDLSAADAGELRLAKEPVSLAGLLDTTAMGHRAAAAAADVRLAVEADPALPPLPADPVRLGQAVGNLLSNAIRHTPAGGSVTLRARHEDGTAVIEVSDTGTGIAPEELPHVFERFWRADKSRSRRGGGSGLGLPIVRKLTEAHGGTATAESVPGEGATFTLRIPSPPPARNLTAS
ncbi:HAMP domain-containing sensor histidine kinase [Streptomyces sp. TS71-3]|uniref:sensor histidine kinase n=1 Tax=Streptomyces sp. TS71-3 TaxID=2733862 RepID=UPI001B10E8B8|nr:HAMP domain-containing sensor histidine kinase [Streptomyces sp. TS71-3]GHJ36653.1 two-component sensor histidine kinase [Streptomyces sp. TS71-3]